MSGGSRSVRALHSLGSLVPDPNRSTWASLHLRHQGALHKYLSKRDVVKAGSLTRGRLLEEELTISLSKHLVLFNKIGHFPHCF